MFKPYLYWIKRNAMLENVIFITRWSKRVTSFQSTKKYIEIVYVFFNIKYREEEINCLLFDPF